MSILSFFFLFLQHHSAPPFIFACSVFLSVPYFLLCLYPKVPIQASQYFCPLSSRFSPFPISAFTKLNSGANPSSLHPQEKKGEQKGKDSSLLGINIKMKVAPYFCTPHKKKSRMRKGRQTRTRNTIKREEQSRKEKKWMRDRETIWGDRGEGLATATLSCIKKMCCSLFSLASLFSHSFCHSLFLSFSLSPLSWPFKSLKRYREEGRREEGFEGWEEGGCFILSSLSLQCQQNKNTNSTAPRECVCVWCVFAQISINTLVYSPMIQPWII